MIRIVESLRNFGSMNAGTIRYSNLTEEDKKMLCARHNITLKELEDYDLTHDKKELFAIHRKKFGARMGFDGRRMFMADQEHKTGSHFEITEEYVHENPEGWTDIPEDILVVRSNLPGVVIGHPVADCPVVMLSDRKNGITAIGHCSGEMVDHHLPEMIMEVLRRDYGSRAEDIFAYISASVGDGWTYDCFPKWAKDMKVWDHAIMMGEDGLFHISLKPAILKQLILAGVEREKMLFSMDDTSKDPNYYSHSVASSKENPDPSKFGRHFAGMFYTEDGQDDVEIRKGR
jgi:copper oxidase (laccase) domain-containing protein